MKRIPVAALLLLALSCRHGSGEAVKARPDTYDGSDVAPVAAPASIEVDTHALEAFGLRVTPGFRVTRVADETLADDIYSLTFTVAGRVAVSSRGWIKVLFDDNGDGQADRAEVVHETASGSHGMLFDGDDLYSYEEEGLWRFPGGKGPGQRLLSGKFGEHGGHQMKRGPDGQLYFMASNMSDIAARNPIAPHSPITQPIAGMLMRLTEKDAGETREVVSEILSDGLRNPYRFDFSAGGELLTYDSDCEGDVFLPWYEPTRIQHLAHGGHHGWMLDGWRRSFPRPDRYPDVQPILQRIGLGSPTGVVVYRHNVFPSRYREGVFAVDWTYGRIYFVPLAAAGAGLNADAVETVVEATGTEGFAPSDAAVGPDGALYISIGGRGTRGSVFRLAWAGPAPKVTPAGSDLDQVLRAVQPLDVWSRAAWMPVARKLGAAPFAAAAEDPGRATAERVRAVEILVELFGSLPLPVARTAIVDSDVGVRARAAWALGRNGDPGADASILRLAEDASPLVRRLAIEALDRVMDPALSASVGRVVRVGLADADKRVRLAAIWLASRLPASPWKVLATSVRGGGDHQARLSLALAAIWRVPGGRLQGLLKADARTRLAVLGDVKIVLTNPGDPETVASAVRVLALALGDQNLETPSVEVFSMYQARKTLPAADRRVLGNLLVAAFAGADADVGAEILRTLAMLQPAALPSAFFDQVAAQMAGVTDATQIFGWLIAVSRLSGKRSVESTRAFADTLLAVRRRLGAQAAPMLQNWHLRVGELVTELSRSDRAMGPLLAKHDALLDPERVALARGLPIRDQITVAERILAQVPAANDTMPWSPDVVALVSTLPVNRAGPALRAHLSDSALRDAVLLSLAARPEAADRDVFVSGLDSYAAPVRVACVAALDRIGPGDAADTRLALMRLLQRLTQDAAARDARARVLRVLGRMRSGAGKVAALPVVKEPEGLRGVALTEAYQPVLAWYATIDAKNAATLASPDDGVPWLTDLDNVPWSQGDAGRGEEILRARACLTCHGGDGAFGPSLAGAANRMSVADLFTAIVRPSADVAPAFQALVVQARDGALYTGLVVYQGPDSLLLRTGPDTTLRFTSKDIVSTMPGDASVMPPGLLAGLEPAGAADVYAYLRTLK